MKLFSKYVFPPFITLFFLCLGGAFILLVDIVVPIGFDYLAMKLPDVFVRPNSLSQPEEYEAFQATLGVIEILITIWVATKLSMRFDNKRFEYIVVRTEGLYKVPDMTKEYVREFWLSDIINSAIAPLILLIPPYFIPADYMRFFSLPLWCGARLVGYFSLVDALVIVVGSSIIIRFLLIPSILCIWRARWLTGDID